MRSTRSLTLVIASALFMESLDSTVIATSLSAIAADIHVDPITLKLAFTAYYLALAIFIPISGWCADRFGAKTVFRLAIATFTLSSVGCAMAWDLPSLVAGRFCQGLGGAMMLPVGRLILLRVIPKSELVSAMAMLSIPALFAPIMGPPVGGYITTYYHWRGIFWLNVPVGLLGLVLATWLVPQVKAEVMRPLDVRGFLMTASGLCLTIFGFTLASGSFGNARTAWIMVGCGVVLLALYVRHAARTEHPILELRLLRIVTFRTAMMGGLMFRLSVGAIPFLLPMMLQVGFGLSPFESGSLTFAAAAGALTMKLTAAPILRRFGFRRILTVNAVISSALLAASALFTANTPHAIIVTVLLVAGFFRSLQFTSLNALGYADVDTDQMSRATSFVAVIQQLALSSGVAIAAMLLEAFRAADGRTVLLAGDFSRAFMVIGVIAVLSSLVFFRLAPDAGTEVSGHRPAPR
ncbi:MAG TPA: MDR family MFS transporter [Burkholderiaceae bacterium]|jgi:EmrB/QacA subfamily drug resistance transporter|nr:MDR family MFS transporter [Burkholderiaceae bacterium]